MTGAQRAEGETVEEKPMRREDPVYRGLTTHVKETGFPNTYNRKHPESFKLAGWEKWHD